MPIDELATPHRVVTRRVLIGGAAASAGATLFPSPAPAFFPAILEGVLEGIDALVTLWNGYKMIKEIYDQFFAGQGTSVTQEAARIYGPQNFNVDNYYKFGNPYEVRDLSGTEPGCQISHRVYPNAKALCCGAQEGPVFLSTGCIIALHAATQNLRASFADDNLFGYTRPIRYVTPVEPWQEIDSFGNVLKSDVQYYSPSGSVALRWLITDREARKCRGEYKIRDDNSLTIVAEGATSEFYY